MVALLALGVPLVFYLANAKSPREQNLLDRAIVFVSAPVQWLTVCVLDGTTSVWHHYIGLIGVQQENDRLRAENAKLSRQLAEREEQRLENERLRLLVGLKDRAPEVSMLFAHVIATSPTPLFRSLRIDRGANDGVKQGAAVVGYDGAVGRIAAAGDSWSDIMLLVDANSSTDVLIQRTRARARVRGAGNDAHLGIEVEYLSRSADVEPGDVLVTSGTGVIFPKGLRVGTVMAVERGAFGLYQHATVAPSVDFGRLESVMVVVSGFGDSTTFEEGPATIESHGPIVDTASGGPLAIPAALIPAPSAPVAPSAATVTPVFPAARGESHVPAPPPTSTNP